MPAADSSNPPSANNSSSAADEASQLELHLQRQLEEDVARIFDESIYTDLEVVCGKLKILTHSCILRARTNNFYRVLETTLHVNFGRSAFDEVYSFISDTYTECNLKHQEKEILHYLTSISSSFNSNKGGEEPEEHFLTPKCVSPYIEKGYKKTVSASPSTELTKEYYSLVPIENNLLDKELIEQDELSSAFQSIISSQSEDFDNSKTFQRNKPTSLALVSSHSPKSVKHSNSCDILIKSNLKDDVLFDTGKKSVENKELIILSQNKNLESEKSSSILCKDTKSCYPDSEKVGETAYSPDSLITDELSSSSDYLSAAYACSPGVAPVCAQQLNVGTNIAKMENIFTSSDSGLENTGLLESLTSHKDVTLTDMSLTESTLHELTTDDGSNSHNSVSNPLVEKEMLTAMRPDTSVIDSNSQTSHNSERLNEFTCNSSKEEKQRQNEEIVILESSSLSSETGSWESVFPPKLPTKKVCEKFIHSERHHFTESEPRDPLKQTIIQAPSESYTDMSQNHVLKSAFKSTSCFIDAASLADEEDTANNVVEIVPTDALIPMPSRPVPCSTNRTDISPNDGSENDNEDSLEQLDSKDPDSIQKDLSPTIFEMTPITEDSLCTNAFEQTQNDNDALVTENKQVSSNAHCTKDDSILSNTVFMSNTPHNSIMCLKVSALKQYESEESESDTTVTGRESQKKTHNCQKYSESSPIISGGASVDDHLPIIGSYSGSPLTRRRIENIPIVSGAYSYVPAAEVEKQAKSPRPSCANAWVVDMSSANKSDTDKIGSNQTHNTKKPTDKVCNSLRNSSKNSSSLENCSKSRSSVDSDSSERSSHKFYIDLSTLPNPITPKNQTESENACEKKNMFSMYIDFSEKPILKEIPARLTTMSTKKNNTNDPKDSTKSKTNETTPVNVAKIVEPNSTSIFEKYESLCEDPNISISEIIGLPEKDRKEVKQNDRKNTESNEKQEMERRNHCGERAFHRNPRSTIHEESVADQEVEPFVRLSDLDKPVQKADPPLVKKPVRTLGERMTRSIPDNNWCEQQNQASTSRSNEIVSSFHSENALSLNRLFPHLRNEFSRSMPGSLSSRTRSPLRSGACSSPGDMEDQASDTSEMSSVQSSFCRSNVENSTTEETSQASSLLSNCQSRLGQDLLRMFLEEIAPDVIVEVSGRRIKAHKCILSSRCQYFAGILSGGWVESAGNVIALPPFSYNVVHFALCHIYSGISVIPDAISIVELATLADMLSLEGLKEAIMFTLKAKYCHHFHEPCAVCKAGVLECFPLCSVYGLDDLYRKCLDWIIKYFPWVVPTKAFATLPTELLDKCYQEMVSNMTIESVIGNVYTIGLTGICVTSQEDLTSVRWGEVVIRLCRRLIHAAARLIAPNLMHAFRELGDLPHDPPPTVRKAVDDCITAAIEWAPCGEACNAYYLLTRIAKDIRLNRHVEPDLLTMGNNSLGINNMLYANALNWMMHCESAVVRAAPRVCTTPDFMALPIELRRKLQELGCISYGQPPVVGAPPPLQLNRRSRSTTQSKPNKPPSTTATSQSRNAEIDQVRASFVPYAPKPPKLSAETVADPNFEIRMQEAIILSYNTARLVRTTKAQEERAKFNLSKTKTTSQERLSARAPKTSFENTKPRYLEPKVCPEHFKKTLTAPKLANKISSSESSRNSSPIQARNLRTSRMKTRQVNEATKAQALSQDSLATSSRPRTAEPSTDSLSESQTSNKYATYTKPKKPATKGSVESIKCAKNAAAPNPSTDVKAKLKTKIPVYLNSLSKSQTSDRKSSTGNTAKASTTTTTNSSASLPTRKAPEKSSSCSLMNATKSSQAKMVTKVVKGATKSKPAQKNKKNSKQPQRRGDEPPADIPVMERSGTFLKDEPTFGEKTKNIDLDK